MKRQDYYLGVLLAFMIMASVATIYAACEWKSLGSSDNASIPLDRDFVAFCRSCMGAPEVQLEFTRISKRPGKSFVQSIEEETGELADDDSQMTASLIASHRHRFEVPEYAYLMRNTVLPQFADMIIERMEYFALRHVEGSTFWFYFPRDITGADRTLASRAVEAVLFMRRLCRKNIEESTFHILLVDEPKIFDSARGEFPGQPRFINSGITPDSSHVIVFRREEVVKVLVHEMCHLLRLDIRGESYSLSRALRGRVCSIRGAFNPTESITECLAQFLYSILISEWEDIPLPVVLDRQLRHGYSQSAKILALSGIKSMGDLLATEIRQTTFMFEYFILRTALTRRVLMCPEFLATLFCQTRFLPRLPDSAVAGAVEAALLADVKAGSAFGTDMDMALQSVDLTDLNLTMNAFA